MSFPGPSSTHSAAHPQNFCTTHWSVVLRAGDGPAPEADAALERLCATYWYPIYSWLRRQGSPPHDAQDLALAQKDMRKRGLQLQVVYHSHPHDPARPSVTDIKIATDYEDYWGKINLPIPAYTIVSLMHAAPDLRTYWIKGGTVSITDLRII